MPVEAVEVVFITLIMIIVSFFLIYLFSNYTNFQQIYKLVGIYILNNDYNCLAISEIYTNSQIVCQSSFSYTSFSSFYKNNIYLTFSGMIFYTNTPSNQSFYGNGFESFIINRYTNSSTIV